MRRPSFSGDCIRRAPRLRVFLLAAAISCLLAGCHHAAPLDITALDNSGIGFSAIQTLKGMDVTNDEAAQLIKAKQGGFSDDDCVAVVRLARQRKEPFQAGEDIANLLRAGIAESTVMQLAELNQIGLWSGEAQAMRLAGLSDQIILEEAHRRSAGLSVLSGASLANFKNAGIREATLLQLVRRGVPDNEAPTIIALRRRGWSDAQILRRYPGGR